MAKIKISKPRCTDCPYFIQHTSSIPKKCRGILLKNGCRYCTGGKKVRRFMAKDPKIYVPYWCPIQKVPPVLRIYCHKDSETSFLEYILKADGIIFTPSGYRYALRQECPSPVSAREFVQRLEEEPIDKILNQAIYTDEVLEFDNGLLPQFFWKREWGDIVAIDFDSKRAQKNTLEKGEI